MYTNQEDLLEQARQGLLRIRIPWKGLRIGELKNIAYIRYSMEQKAWLKSQIELYRQNRTNLYRIERHNGDQFNEKSIQLINKYSLTKAGTIKTDPLHWMRNSVVNCEIIVATHLIDQETYLDYIQELFAHNST